MPISNNANKKLTSSKVLSEALGKATSAVVLEVSRLKDRLVDGSIPVSGVARETSTLLANPSPGSSVLAMQALALEISDLRSSIGILNLEKASSLGATDFLLLQDSKKRFKRIAGTELHSGHTHVEDDITDLQSYLLNIVEDTSPQLGGMLDVNGQAIGDGTLELLTFTETASAVNHVNIKNAASALSPLISAVGDDTNVGLFFAPKGSESIRFLDGNDSTNVVAFITPGLTTGALVLLTFDQTSFRTIKFPDATTRLVGAAANIADNEIMRGDGGVSGSQGSGFSISDGAQMLMPFGTAAAPPISFDGDPDSGFYRTAADKIGLSLGGFQKFLFDSAGFSLGMAGNPLNVAIKKTGNTGTGFFFPSSTELAASAGGVEVMRWQPNGVEIPQGLQAVKVQATEPTDPLVGQLWLHTN